MSNHHIITGGATGIGFAIAKRLTEDGHQVSLLARNSERLSRAVSALNTPLSAPSAAAFTCDIRDRESIDAAIGAAVEQFGPLRGAIANAGIGGPNTPDAKGFDQHFEDLIQTNLVGTYYTMRVAQKALVNDQNPRHLLIVSSCLARFGVPGYTGYCASKAALLGLTRALALELAEQNIQVNALCPGWVDTKMAREGIQAFAEETGQSFEAAKANAMQAVPMGRMSQPSEVAGVVRWLLSTDARGITGQGIDINGGSWMG